MENSKPRQPACRQAGTSTEWPCKPSNPAYILYIILLLGTINDCVFSLLCYNEKDTMKTHQKLTSSCLPFLFLFLVLRFAETNLPPVYDAVPPSSAPPPEAPWIPQDPGFVVEPSPAPTFEPSPTATPELSTATPTNSPTRAVPSATPTEAQPTSTSTPTRSPVTPGSQKG